MTEEPRVPFLLRYVAYFVAACVGALMLRFVLAQTVGFQLGLGGLAIIPSLTAAMLTGRHWGQMRGDVPDNRQAWRYALVAGSAILALLMLVLPLGLAALRPEPPVMIQIAMMAGFFLLVSVVITRLFLPIGARQALKD